MKEVTLIIEPEDYDVEALKVYQSVSSRVLFGFRHEEAVAATNLVCRLKHRLGRDFLSQFPNLKRIASPTTGLDHIDEHYCKKMGIEIISLASAPAGLDRITSTAELTVGLIISLVRQQHLASGSVIHNLEWDRYKFKARQLSNLTLGIVGLGRVGRMVANLAGPLFESVVAHDTKSISDGTQDSPIDMRSLNYVLQNADVVSLHANFVLGMEPIIGSRELEFMKPGGFLVNTSRSGLVDEKAVADVINSSLLGGYACDVLDGEPLDSYQIQQNPIWQSAKSGKNVIITPHIGGCTADAMKATELIVAKALADAVSRVG
jgi:D-3-phosphoglycerate dehydrogenase